MEKTNLTKEEKLEKAEDEKLIATLKYFSIKMSQLKEDATDDILASIMQESCCVYTETVEEAEKMILEVSAVLLQSIEGRQDAE